MASKNVEIFRKVHDCFNRRDFDGTMETLADDPSYVEHPSGRTLRGKDQLREFLQGWASAFSDGEIVNAQYIDAGDTVIAQFTFEGTNDGAFAGMPATGKRVSVPICEIARYDAHGRVISAGVYYDTMTICTQLGIMKPLATAA
jgi:steroid delta-isomerase-like uncharacterized protein